MKKITFTFDLEDHRVSKNNDFSRIEKNCYKLLDWLEERKFKATFFVIGGIAMKLPKLIRDIDLGGHEIGSHSYEHISLLKHDAKSFSLNIDKSKRVIEDICGKAVTGFRAPYFSMTNDTKWVTDILFQKGFIYSSSVVPKEYSNFGMNNVPNNAFYWPSGLLELPMVLGSLGGYKFPCIGGIYIKLLPLFLIQKSLPSKGVFWTYLHPYDYDASEPYTKIHGTGHLGSFLLWIRRKSVLKKTEKLLSGFKKETFINRIINNEFSNAIKLEELT